MKNKKAYLGGGLALLAVIIWILNYVRNGTNMWWGLLLALGTIGLLFKKGYGEPL
jgi:hypothetical protein